MRQDEERVNIKNATIKKEFMVGEWGKASGNFKLFKGSILTGFGTPNTMLVTRTEKRWDTTGYAEAEITHNR